MVAIPSSLTQVSPTTTTRNGSVALMSCGLFLKVRASVTNRPPGCKRLIAFATKYSYGITRMRDLLNREQSMDDSPEGYGLLVVHPAVGADTLFRPTPRARR